jgi:hypothetical protein
MANSDALGDRRRASEEDYFRKREQELLDQLRKRAAAQADRQRLAEAAGLSDDELLTKLESLGFTPDTIKLLELVPLVQVAWAEGNLSKREGELILEAARAHGIEEGTPAHAKLTGWLTVAPSEALFETALRIIPAMLSGLSADARASSQRSLMGHLERVAAASGGLLGLRAVSPEERAVLSRVAAELERAHPRAAHDVVENQE